MDYNWEALAFYSIVSMLLYMGFLFLLLIAKSIWKTK